jgi:hypothetical protein
MVVTEIKRNRKMSVKEHNTREESIKQFLDAIFLLRKKIISNSASVADYIYLEELFSTIGVDIKTKLTDNGFTDWNNYYNIRQKGSDSENMVKAGSVTGFITGSLDAISEVLMKTIKE